jgi:hypothetical protein
MTGIERRKPKCAPEAVASVVAPPGVMVEMSAKRIRGNRESMVMPGNLRFQRRHRQMAFIRKTNIERVMH